MPNKYAVAQVSIVAPPELPDHTPQQLVGLPIPDSQIMVQFTTAASDQQVVNARAVLSEHGHNGTVSTMRGGKPGESRSIISIPYDGNFDTMKDVCALMGCRPPPEPGTPQRTP